MKGFFYFLLVSILAAAIAFIAYTYKIDSTAGIEYSSLVSSFATLAIAILTVILAIETWSLRSLQNQQIRMDKINSVQPLVTLELVEGNSINDRNVVVRNLGKGIAFDVSFEFLSENESGISDAFIIDKLNSHGFIRDGVRNLGIKQVIESHLFLFHEVPGEVFSVKINVAISYSDVYANRYENKIGLILSEFENISRLGISYEEENKRALKSISESLVSIAKNKSV